MRRPRVLLADDHPMMLEGLRKLLEPACEVVGTMMEGDGLVEAAKRLRPDFVIADISMPGIDGIEATRRLHAALPGLLILILSFNSEPSWVRAAFEAGAAMPGAGVSPERRRPELREAFTRREHDVIRLVGLGLGNKEIARRLGVSVTTVRTHLNKVYDKLGTASRVELALLAAQTGNTVM